MRAKLLCEIVVLLLEYSLLLFKKSFFNSVLLGKQVKEVSKTMKKVMKNDLKI